MVNGIKRIRMQPCIFRVLLKSHYGQQAFEVSLSYQDVEMFAVPVWLEKKIPAFATYLWPSFDATKRISDRGNVWQKLAEANLWYNERPSLPYGTGGTHYHSLPVGVGDIIRVLGIHFPLCHASWQLTLIWFSFILGTQRWVTVLRSDGTGGQGRSICCSSR